MTTTLIKRPEVTRPATTRITSTILDQATVVDNAVRMGFGSDAGLWNSYNCMDTLVPTPLCPDPQVGFNTFRNAVWQPGFTFAMQGGVQCNAIGLDTNDQFSELKRVFEINEGKGVEQALLLNRFVALSATVTDTGQAVQWDGPTVLGAGKTLSPVVALALLEGYAASIYAGLPTIHMPRAMATVLASNGLIVWVGDKAFTKNGSKIAMGGGYDVSEADGTWDLFATGEVYVERSEVIEIQSWVQPGDGSGVGGGKNGIPENSVVSLAERMYRVGVDCFVAKATATVFT